MFTLVYLCSTPLFSLFYLCLLVFKTVCSWMFTHVYKCLASYAYHYPCLPMSITDTRACLPMITHVHSSLPTYTLVYLCLHLFTRATYVYLYLLTFTTVYSCLPMFTTDHLCMFTYVCPCFLEFTYAYTFYLF